jgi:hypothetical protein
MRSKSYLKDGSLEDTNCFCKESRNDDYHITFWKQYLVNFFWDTIKGYRDRVSIFRDGRDVF